MNQESNNLNNQNENNNFQSNLSATNQNNYNQFENNTKTSSDNNKNNKKKLVLIILLLVAAIVISIVIFTNKDNSDSVDGVGNGYTANFGETLKINELKGIYNFELEILSVEKNYFIDEFFYTGECLALKVRIKNNSKDDLEILPYMMKFNLLDSSRNEISSLNISMSSTFKNAINEIPSGQVVSGYFYFYDYGDNGEYTNIKSADVAMLEVEVMSTMKKEDGVISGNYEQYYIWLK